MITIKGTNGNDYGLRSAVVDLDKNHTFLGLKGDDRIWQGYGSDIAKGGPGTDEIKTDEIAGVSVSQETGAEPGKVDFLFLDYFGDDVLDGGPDNDTVWLSFGNDRASGGPGYDVVFLPDKEIVDANHLVTFFYKTTFTTSQPARTVADLNSGTVTAPGGMVTTKVDWSRYEDGPSGPVWVTTTILERTDSDIGAVNASISGFEAMVGSRFKDIMRGSDRTGVVEVFEKGPNGEESGDSIVGRGGLDVASYVGLKYSGINADLAKRTVTGVPVSDESGVKPFTDVLSGIEGIYGSNMADVINGDAEDNILNGRDGDDVIDGRGGEDTVKYNTGELGRILESHVMFWDGHLGVVVDLADGEATDDNGDQDYLSNIENVEGSLLSDKIYGDGGSNKLFGLDGYDTLDGRGGADFLHGAEGNDTLVGGKGRDWLDGGDGADTLTGGKGKDEFIFNGIPVEVDTITDFQFGTDKINKTSPASAGAFPDAGVPAGISLPPTALLLDALGEKDMVVKIGESPLFKLGGGIQGFNEFLKKSVLKIDKAIVGTDGIDDLRGTSKADFIYGLGGIDRLSGGKGNDFLSGGDLYDHLFGGKGNDTLLGGDGRDILNGNNGDNRLYGGEDYDILVTSTGDDILDGGPEFDRMSGGPGKDIFVVSDNTGYPIGRADLIQDFDLGVDKVDLSGLFIGDRHLVESDLSFVGNFGGRVIVSVNGPFHSTEIAEINFSAKGFGTIGEKAFLKSNPFIFTGGPASIVGSNGGDTSTGTNGDDVFFGGRGFDTLRGKNGNDILDGGDAKDTLVGGQGVDQLFGGAGNDQLDGGAGDDILQGDSGNDNLTGGTDNDYLFGGSGGDTLIGGDGDDFLSGGAGKDILTGGDGADDFHFVDVSDRFTDVITDFELGVDRISIGESVKKNFKFEMTDSFLKLFSDDAQSKPFLKLDLGEGLHKLLTDAELF